MVDYFEDYAEVSNYLSQFSKENLNVVWVKQVTKDIPHRWDVHVHDSHEFMYHLGGKATIKMNDGKSHGDSLAVIASDLLYIPPRIAHEGFSDLEWSEEMIVVHFTMPTEYDFKTYIKLKCSDNAYPWLFRQIAKEYSSSEDYHVELMNHYLTSIVLMLKRQFVSQPNIKKDIISWSIRCMVDHIYDKINIEELANSVYMSESSFSKLFKKRIGTSPLHYYNLLKVEIAKEDLLAKNLHVGEIAEMLGYEDPLYFSRIFKKEVGLSPREFRKSYL
jgi:AraC family transcriptional regulator of arabinose operon